MKVDKELSLAGPVDTKPIMSDRKGSLKVTITPAQHKTLTHLPKRPPVDLAFTDLTYRVQEGRKSSKLSFFAIKQHQSYYWSLRSPWVFLVKKLSEEKQCPFILCLPFSIAVYLIKINTSNKEFVLLKTNHSFYTKSNALHYSYVLLASAALATKDLC